MRNLIKSAVKGSLFEGVCRKVDKKISQLVFHLKKTIARSGAHDKYDAETFQVMKRLLRRGSNCIDVGCHNGEMLKEMLKYSPEGLHFAFEPLPEFFERLTEAFAKFPNVHLFHCALSDREGQTTFQHVVSNPAYSGILKRTYARENEVIQQITVGLRRIDEIIPTNLSTDFIKIDVEGAEYQVLQGGVETIRRCQPTIVFEHGLGAADHYGTKPEQVFELLVDQCGLDIHLMTSWLKNRAAAPLSLHEFQDQFWSGKNYYFMATSAITKDRY